MDRRQFMTATAGANRGGEHAGRSTARRASVRQPQRKRRRRPQGTPSLEKSLLHALKHEYRPDDDHDTTALSVDAQDSRGWHAAIGGWRDGFAADARGEGACQTSRYEDHVLVDDSIRQAIGELGARVEGQ